MNQINCPICGNKCVRRAEKQKREHNAGYARNAKLR